MPDHLVTVHQDTLSRPRPAAGLAVLAPGVVLPGMYVVAVVLLLASRVREFADESDNLLGGYLIARGERLYADYFSNHMPLPYFLAAIPSLLGASRIEQFRVYTDALLIAATLGIAWGLMYRRGLGWTVAGAWATITVYAHTVQWGEMLHAGTCAGFGLLAAGLLFYTIPPGRVDRSAATDCSGVPARSPDPVPSAGAGGSAGPGRSAESSPRASLLPEAGSVPAPAQRFSGRDELILAAAVFVAVQSELLSIYPLALLGLCYGAARARPGLRQRNLAPVGRADGQMLFGNPWRLALLILVPNVLVLVIFAALGSLGAFVYDAYQFNQTYYAQFVMNGSILGMLHDWEAQYRTYLLSSLFNPLGLEGCLVLGNLSAAYLTARTRGLVPGIVYFAFVSLCRVRNGGPYYLASYFSLALVLAWALSALARGGVSRQRLRPVVASLAGLALVLAFLLDVAKTYDFSQTSAYTAPEQPVLQAVTSPDDRIFVAPYDPYLYLASARLPVSTYEFYFPWQAADPKSDAQILTELRQRRPTAIVFRQDDMVNGQYLTRDWASHLQRLLDDEHYVALDLADVFVPAERLSEARARLRAAGLAPP